MASEIPVMSRQQPEQSPERPLGHDVSWTILDLEELIEAYWETIAPAMEDAGLDPEEDRPTHEWLSANGFRGLIYALREYHDRTFGEFWAEDLGLEQADDCYDWGISHESTIELLETYLESRRSRGNLTESSEDTLRYRLAKYVRAYAAVNDTEDVITPVSRESDVPAYAATDQAWAAFDRLDDELSPQTMRRVHEAVDHWYAHLVRRKRASTNPVSGLEDEYRWSQRVTERENEVSNPALAAEHVQDLYRTADSTSERLLVIALCAWGLRSGEVAALHRSQLVLDPHDTEVPYVAFTERKNGPGQVSILYGRRTAEDRILELDEMDDWNGYLFPSQRSSSGHISRQTVLNRFDDLADRGNLPEEIHGRKPVPQMGRRFWYDAFSTTQEALIEEVGEIAAEQGSASAEVVLSDYLSEDRRRKLRREYMADQLANAFESSY